jgi:Kef-type K+ transport system membrane component KefB
VIIGAFLAGMVFAEAREHFELKHQALPVYEFLVPFFFVITGSQVDCRLFVTPSLMALALGVTILALLGKFVGGRFGVLGLGGAAWPLWG